MTNHTPGPWHLIDQTEIRNARGCTVCVTSEYRVPGREQEAIADARLIAAAPELLNILQTIASSNIVMSVMHEKYRDFIRAAIAKATT
jgi:hypothetical protein